MDPYTDGHQAAEADLRIRTAFERVKYAARQLPRVGHRQSDTLQDVNHSRSQKVAQFVRNRPRLPRPVKLGFAALGLASLVWTLLRKRLKR
jgi:hypothetical protein